MKEDKIEEINKAIQDCTENEMLSDSLTRRGELIADMLLEEYNYNMYRELVEEIEEMVENLQERDATKDFIKEQLMERFGLTEKNALTFI